MTIVDAALGIEAGIALAMSLAEGEPLAVIAVGALGVGAEVASAALVGALTGRVPAGLDDPDAERAAALGVQQRSGSSSGDTGRALELLAAFGGSETAVIAGLMLGAASINVPVILDSYATGSAALIAAVIAPAVTGSLIAAHRGSFTMAAILDHLGLAPIFDVGLGHGEGSGAAMVLPLIDQVCSLARG
jgi:nicotinate-nucleotide--dimethylbenzimidazole phosphoribosyltransferase